MAAEQRATEIATAPAPTETNISREHAFTDVIYLAMENVKIIKPLDALLSVYTEGCGRVDLVSVTVRVTAREPGAYVKAGFAQHGSTMTHDMVSMKANGVNFCSNTLNVGNRVTFDLVPEDLYSRQVRPPSANLPMPQLYVEAGGKMNGMLEIAIKVLGYRQRYSTLK